MCNPLCCKCCGIIFVVVALTSIALHTWMLVEHGDFTSPKLAVIGSVLAGVCGFFIIGLSVCHHFFEKLRQTWCKLNATRAFALSCSLLIVGSFICVIITTINTLHDCATCKEENNRNSTAFVCNSDFCENHHDLVLLTAAALLPVQFIYSAVFFAYACCCVCMNVKPKTRKKTKNASRDENFPLKKR